MDSAGWKPTFPSASACCAAEEALPVVLNLLDQLYGLHQVLDDIRTAVDCLPPGLRRELELHLARVPRE